jgi:hypothetical protein
LPVIIVEDALSPNAPHIRDLMAADCHFILSVKPGDHAHLFEQFLERIKVGQVGRFEVVEANGTRHLYLFANGLSLNESNPDVLVNIVEYVQLDADGKRYEGTWVTDFELSVKTVRPVVRGGRARWRIENETFNTLKNQGYHFEHNYGHGEKNLCTVFALLMMAAFLIDQVQQKCNALFRAAGEKKGAKCALWEAVRNLFASFEVSSMREIYEAIVYGYKRPQLKRLVEQALAEGETPNTS